MRLTALALLVLGVTAHAQAADEPAAAATADPARPAPAAGATDEPTLEAPAPLTPKSEAGPVEGEQAAAPGQPVVKRASWLTSVSYALLGVGVVAAAVGVYFAATSAAARAAVVADRMMPGFSSQQLDARDLTAITQARVANGLFITAAAVVVAGVVLFVLGS